MNKMSVVFVMLLFEACVPNPIYVSGRGNGMETGKGDLLNLPDSTAVLSSETGVASYYADKFHGKRTANGEIYDMHGYTAAHKKLPFGTIVEVTNLSNNNKVRLRITDRGPFVDNRIIDVTLTAAKELDMLKSGTAEVRIDVLKWGK